jgi:diguanylate cyclase (GGDEF)-like protein
MGVYAKALLIGAVVVALTLSALVVTYGVSVPDAPWAGPWIAAAGLLVAGCVALALYFLGKTTQSGLPPGVSLRPTADEPAPAAAADAARDDFFTDASFLGFVEQLMAATTSEELLATVHAQLPPLIGGRHVWIVSDLQKRTAEDEIVSATVSPGAQVTAEIQEWTTFPLRLNDTSVGLLGVESSGGLGANRRQAIQRLTVLLAQAITTVGTIETFRQAGLVDLLTGAATRREGLNRLQSEVKRAQRSGTSMAILMIDLDHFKSVNDRFGHAVGDALLTVIGRTLRGTLRASDVVCRWGGEEFLIVLPDTDLTRAQVVATHLLHNIGGTQIPTPTGQVTTTASIGVTISRPGETAPNNLVARADLALYRAKRDGRSCIRIVLGDPDGRPIGAEGGASEPAEPRNSTLPFTDRRNPNRTDRRSMPSPGRRSTDPRPPADPTDAGEAGGERRRASGTG